MRSVWLLVGMASLLLSGCVSTTTMDSVPEAGEPDTRQVLLHCLGEDGGIPALESSFFGSCWGHIGHHTYVLDPPVQVLHINGSLFAVEVEATAAAGEPTLAVEASLDGRAWTPVAAIAYPLGSGEGRYDIPFDAVVDSPARFLRFSMPPSAFEGLAGYLDHSWANLTVRPLAEGPALEPRPRGDCSEGLLDSFFADHPCWFGGYDPVDANQGGDPALVHATAFPEQSWYDSPSFLHTYALGDGLGGSLQATMRSQLWRAPQHFSCAAFDPTNLDVLAIALVQASPDGRSWTEVARAMAQDDAPVQLTGEVPDGSRFLRFGTDRTAAWDRGACHHSRSFVVESAYSIH